MTLNPKWTQTVDEAVDDPAWDEYDSLIQREVDDYNRRLAETPGFKPLDWKMFKAIVWVESGGPKSFTWETRPLHIGSPGDKGLAVLRDGQEAADLIMSNALKQDIQGNILRPELNIRAGIAYALDRLCHSDVQSVNDPDHPTILNQTALAGDSLDRIARRVGSTVASMRKLNPGLVATQLHVGQRESGTARHTCTRDYRVGRADAVQPGVPVLPR